MPGRPRKVVDISTGKIGKDKRKSRKEQVLRVRGKWPSKGKVPGFRLEAPGTAIPAAGDEQGDPHPNAVCDVAGFDFSVIHRLTDAARAL